MYLIDGHNLIGSGQIPGIRLDEEDDEWRLVRWLRARRPRLRQNIVVVFDGGVPGGRSRGLSGGGVSVIFAAAHRSRADRVILNRLQAERPATHVQVVTNDAVLRQAALGQGATVLSAADFVARCNQIRKKRRPTHHTQPSEPPLSPQEMEYWLKQFGGAADEDETNNR